MQEYRRTVFSSDESTYIRYSMFDIRYSVSWNVCFVFQFHSTDRITPARRDRTVLLPFCLNCRSMLVNFRRSIRLNFEWRYPRKSTSSRRTFPSVRRFTILHPWSRPGVEILQIRSSTEALELPRLERSHDGTTGSGRRSLAEECLLYPGPQPQRAGRALLEGRGRP